MGFISKVLGFDEREEKLSNEILRLRHQNARIASQSRESGVQYSFGRYDRERTQALQSTKKFDTYEDMLTDPHVSAGIDATIIPLLRASWSIEPASDKPKDKEIAAFCEAVLLQRTEPDSQYGKDYFCDIPWELRLFEILDMFCNGFSVFNKVWMPVEDKLILKDLEWLEPRSVDPSLGWKLEGNRFAGLKRTYRTTKGGMDIHKDVPASDLYLYPWNLRGARYDGNPMLRSLYGPWFRKNFLQRISVIWAQKAGSPVPVVFYPKGTEADADQYVELAKLLRGESPEDAFFAGPMGKDGTEPTVRYADVGAKEVDRMGPLVDRENSEMSHGSGTKSRMLGETQFGSRSTGQTQLTLESPRIQAAVLFVSMFELHGVRGAPGPIKELVDANFADVKEYPRLRASKADPFEHLPKMQLLIQAMEKKLLPEHSLVFRTLAERLDMELPEELFDDMKYPEQQSPFGSRPGESANEDSSKSAENKDRDSKKVPETDDDKLTELIRQNLEEFNAQANEI